MPAFGEALHWPRALRLASIPRVSKTTINFAEDGSGSEDDDEGSEVAPVVENKPFDGREPKFAVRFQRPGEGQPYKAYAEPHGRQRQKGFVELHPVVTSYFTEWINKPKNRQHAQENILCYTEWSNKGVVFRAHPNFRGEGQWYDWAGIIWDTGASSSDSSDSSESAHSPARKKRRDEPDRMEPIIPENWPIEDGSVMAAGEFPAMLLAFFLHPSDNEEMVVIHSTERLKRDHPSKLCEPWELQFNSVKQGDLTALVPKLLSVSVKTITRRLLVIPESQVIPAESLERQNPKHSKRIILVRDMEIYWPRFFTTETRPLL